MPKYEAKAKIAPLRISQWKGNTPEHTQIIQFITGMKKTIRYVVRIDEGEMLNLTTRNGIEFLIFKDKVLWVERILE